MGKNTLVAALLIMHAYIGSPSFLLHSPLPLTSAPWELGKQQYRSLCLRPHFQENPSSGCCPTDRFKCTYLLGQKVYFILLNHHNDLERQNNYFYFPHKKTGSNKSRILPKNREFMSSRARFWPKTCLTLKLKLFPLYFKAQISDNKNVHPQRRQFLLTLL